MHKRTQAYCIGTFLFIAFIILNAVKRSQWAFDSTVALLLFTLIYLSSNFLGLRARELLLIIGGFLSHLLGSFGWYEWSWKFIGYDNITHFIGGLLALIVVTRALTFRLTVRSSNDEAHFSNVKLSTLIILAFCIVMTLGVLVELSEFFGYGYFGVGEGLFFCGSGDGLVNDGSHCDPGWQYIDTMTDILVNMLGMIVGAALLVSHVRYKKKENRKFTFS